MAPAQLRIHADAAAGAGWLARVALAWCAAPQVRVCVDDLQGQRHVDADGLGGLIELPLPANTYHVTARRGGLQRRYTVLLEPGATVDLHLDWRLTTDRA